MNRYVLRIGRQPQGPAPAKTRPLRTAHWVDWIPKAIAVGIIGVLAVTRIGGLW